MTPVKVIYRYHFLIECPALSEVRRPYMECLLCHLDDIIQGPDDLIDMVLNPLRNPNMDMTEESFNPVDLEILTQH